MKLYDHEDSREEFVETVYDLLAGDPDNTRANQIIEAFDRVLPVEAASVEIPFEELAAMDRRTVYVVCWDDPEQNGWATLLTETILDQMFISLRFMDRSKRRVLLSEENYHNPWVPCYREPVRAQPSVFVSGERYRQLKADYSALRQELDALKSEHPDRAGTA